MSLAGWLQGPLGLPKYLKRHKSERVHDVNRYTICLRPLGRTAHTSVIKHAQMNNSMSDAGEGDADGEDLTRSWMISRCTREFYGVLWDWHVASERVIVISADAVMAADLRSCVYVFTMEKDQTYDQESFDMFEHFHISYLLVQAVIRLNPSLLFRKLLSIITFMDRRCNLRWRGSESLLRCVHRRSQGCTQAPPPWSEVKGRSCRGRLSQRQNFVRNILWCVIFTKKKKESKTKGGILPKLWVICQKPFKLCNLKKGYDLKSNICYFCKRIYDKISFSW